MERKRPERSVYLHKLVALRSILIGSNVNGQAVEAVESISLCDATARVQGQAGHP